MIKLNKLNNKEFALNAELIECVESTPDTVITLTSGRKYVVLEPMEEVVKKIISYRRMCYGVE